MTSGHLSPKTAASIHTLMIIDRILEADSASFTFCTSRLGLSLAIHGLSPTFADIRKGRTWAIAVRRGSYKSLFLPNSGRFSLEK